MAKRLISHSVSEHIEQGLSAEVPHAPATPASSSTLEVVDNSKRQTSTEAEKLFLESLLAHLNTVQGVGALSHQEYLVVPLEKRGLSSAVERQLRSITRRYRNARFIIRRPDLLLLKFGLAIEVDGYLHDKRNKRIARDITREAEYAVLGLRCFVVYNDQVYDPAARTQVIRDILAYIEQQRGSTCLRQERQCRRTTICRGRAAFSTAFPQFNIGRFVRNGALLVPFLYGTGVVQWGGFRFTLPQRLGRPEAPLTEAA